MNGAQLVAGELESLADEMRAQAAPGESILVDFEGLIRLAHALERGARVLRGDLPAGQLLIGEAAPPAGPPVQLGNLVMVDFCGHRFRRAMGLHGPGGAA